MVQHHKHVRGHVLANPPPADAPLVGLALRVVHEHVAFQYHVGHASEMLLEIEAQLDDGVGLQGVVRQEVTVRIRVLDGFGEHWQRLRLGHRGRQCLLLDDVLIIHAKRNRVDAPARVSLTRHGLRHVDLGWAGGRSNSHSTGASRCSIVTAQFRSLANGQPNSPAAAKPRKLGSYHQVCDFQSIPLMLARDYSSKLAARSATAPR